MNFPERLEVGRLAGVKTQLGKSDMFPPPSHRNGTFSFGCLGKGCPFPGGRFILRAMLVASEDTLFECCGIHFITAANPSVACGIPVVFIMCCCKKIFYISYSMCHFTDFYSRYLFACRTFYNVCLKQTASFLLCSTFLYPYHI